MSCLDLWLWDWKLGLVRRRVTISSHKSPSKKTSPIQHHGKSCLRWRYLFGIVWIIFKKRWWASAVSLPLLAFWFLLACAWWIQSSKVWALLSQIRSLIHFLCFSQLLCLSLTASLCPHPCSQCCSPAPSFVEGVRTHRCHPPCCRRSRRSRNVTSDLGGQQNDGHYTQQQPVDGTSRKNESSWNRTPDADTITHAGLLQLRKR